MKKRVFSGVLLCLAVMQLAVQYPAPVLSQDVTVDSTVSVTTVTATADLASLSQRDGMAVLIKTGANAGLWRYSKTSTATVDDTTVLNGPGSVGRFLQITIAPGAGSLDVLHDLTGKTAADLDPDATIEFVYYDVNEGTSYKVPLDELRKKGDVSNVANVAALFAATHARDDQLFQTLGYSTEGIGANLYRYDASSTATIDGGFVQPGIGGTLAFDASNVFSGTSGTGRFIAVDQSIFDITKFGAVPDNTQSTDNWGPIQRAINAIPFAGGEVFVPIGNFYITQPLIIKDKSPVVVRGVTGQQGKHGTSSYYSSHIVVSDSFGLDDGAFTITYETSPRHDRGGVTFKNLMIRTWSQLKGAAVKIVKTPDADPAEDFWGNIVIDDCYFMQMNRGLWITNSGGVGYGWIYVMRTRIEACNYGILADCTVNCMTIKDCIVRQNKQESSGSYGTRTGGGIIVAYGTQLLISGNDLEGQQVGIHTGARGVVIENNYFEVLYDAAVVLQGATSVLIEGNYFPSEGTGASKVYIQNCRDVAWENNRGIVPVIHGVNRDVIGDTWEHVILNTTPVGGYAADNTATFLYSPSMVSKLRKADSRSSQRVWNTPALGAATASQGVDGPFFATDRSTRITASSGSGQFHTQLPNTSNTSHEKEKPVTVTSGSASIATPRAHGFWVGEQVSFSAGAMPTGLSAGVWYYVVSTPSATTFSVSATHGGGAITPSSTGTTVKVCAGARYAIESAWIKVPDANTTKRVYCEFRENINSTGTVIKYPATFNASMIVQDEWVLVQIVSKLAIGVSRTSTMQFANMSSGDILDMGGIGSCISTSIFDVPLMTHFTEVTGESYIQIGDRRYRGVAAPTSTNFSWQVGDVIEYEVPAAGGYAGAICTTAGSPGTWKSYGAIAP